MPAWLQMVRSVELLRVEWFGMVRGVREPSGLSRHGDVVAFADDFEAEQLKRLDDAPFGGIHGEPGHQMAMPVSATNASRTGDSPKSPSSPKVSTWKRIAERTSASASS